MKYDDLCDLAQPRLSVITPSLNHGRFLQSTIDSILDQSYRSFEHIVVDGGSTDDTLDILRQNPHIRWVSGPEKNILEAYQKGLAMARGEYVIQCCVSDGFLDRQWFRQCVEALDADSEIAVVWAFAQYMSEEGGLQNVAYQEFFSDPPPQKQDFLAYWLANGFVLPEGNYCVRGDIIKRYFPTDNSPQHYQVHCHLGFMYELMVQGYCPWFVPVVANFGRTHHDQRGKRLRAIEKPAQDRYFADVRAYRRRFLSGAVRHVFRNGRSEIMRGVETAELSAWKRKIWRHRVLRSPLLRTDAYNLAFKLKGRIGRVRGSG